MQDIEITADMGRDDVVKLFRLSEKMIDAIIDDRFLAAPSTERALATRGIVDDRRSHVRAHLIGACQVCAMPSVAESVTLDLLDGSEAAEARMSLKLAEVLEANPFPAKLSDYERHAPVASGQGQPCGCPSVGGHLTGCPVLAECGYVDVATNELPGDAERASQADEDAASYAEILAEQDVEEAWVTRLIGSLDAYVLTEKRIFVSKSYVATMRRIRAERDARNVQVNAMRAEMLVIEGDMFANVDRCVESGDWSWQKGDRVKRRMRQALRPSVGPKRKPSKRSR